VIFRAQNADEMREVGRTLASEFTVGTFVFLNGGLGAGKTTLTQGIGAGLGVTEQIVSPTFTIAREYHSGRLPLLHIDAYRIVTAGGSLANMLDELEVTEIPTFLETGVVVIEWGDELAEQITDQRIEIQIIADHVADGVADDLADGTVEDCSPRIIEVKYIG
jgi:tRNA threonylcarbamoyladenosine biosynthesis protein TsaE